MENNDRLKFISYDGDYPNLCSGLLVLRADGRKFTFWVRLQSGGNVWFDNDWLEHVEHGPWSIAEDAWPEEFPIELRDAAVELVNDCVPWGCCGGCV